MNLMLLSQADYEKAMITRQAVCRRYAGRVPAVGTFCDFRASTGTVRAEVVSGLNAFGEVELQFFEGMAEVRRRVQIEDVLGRAA